MQTWISLCSRHNFRKWRPTPIIIWVNLHNKSWINEIMRDKNTRYSSRIDYFIIPFGGACSIGSLPR